MTLPLEFHPALSRPDLLAAPVAAALTALSADGTASGGTASGGTASGGTAWAGQVRVAAIDPALSDTAEFCARYGISPEVSANCVIIAGKRGGDVTYAACMVAATTRADVNGLVRRHLGARKASFAATEAVIAATGMEYGGITPVGLPPSWPVLVDELVAKSPEIVIGSGIRGSKLWLPGALLASLPGAQILENLGVPV